MMLHRLGLIHKNQRGFTLIELMIAIAITGLIAGGIGATISQIFNINILSGNHMTAVRQVQNAGFWVSNDTQMAQSVVLGTSSGFPVTLTWDGYIDSPTVEYTLVSSELWRDYDGDLMRVAEFIDSENTKATAGGDFSLPDDDDAFTITGGALADSGTISVTGITGSVTATPTGTATVNGSDVQVTITAPGSATWSTPNPDDTIIVTVTAGPATGSWTSTTLTATAAITADGDNNATVATGGVLIFTVTAAVGQANETRVYEITPRPNA